MSKTNNNTKNPQNCYINETDDFSIITSIKCIIKQFPDEEHLYGIKRIDSEPNVVVKGFKIPTWKFILKRYWYFVAALSIITIVSFIAKPVSMMIAAALSFVFYFTYQPYSSEAKVKRTQLFFGLLSICVALAIFYLLFSLQASQGLLFGYLVSYGFFYLIGLFHKYGEIYAINIDELEEWNIATSFVWKTRE
ncbi:MAG TPA: hypothetical protein ENN12_04510 [Epsilonproteobacteria bacterium]|nr:hypothetical protein [Campylobacterota bacterium]